MSRRNVRKLYGDNTLPPPEGDSDEEFKPLYTKKSTSNSMYHGLQVSSQSESDPDEILSDEEEIPKENVKKKKKKKTRKSKQAQKSILNEKLQVKKEHDIDKSVMEVNAMLGVATASSSCHEMLSKCNLVNDIMIVQGRHLNVSNELRRLFGPEAIDQVQKRRARNQSLNWLSKKATIIPPASYLEGFQKVGLSMSVHYKLNGCTYFTFDHSKEYQKLYRKFEQNGRDVSVLLTFNEYLVMLHVEVLLEAADTIFYQEEYSTANRLVEMAIAYMQYVAHPSFNLVDPKVRLEYKVMENRPFHVAILKYLHLLTNRACHRTALELAKLLLNLDPTDPLAVVLIIDTLALRAREHKWLIEAVDMWSKERQAGFLFNMKYSYALAHFHVAYKNKDSLSKADGLLKEAILRFPTLVMKIYECANITPPETIKKNPLFGEASTGKKLRELIYLYAKFTWAKWREPGVNEWFTRNACELSEELVNDKALQERAKELANERLNLFQSFPDEVTRHLMVIKSMSNLLVEGAVPDVKRQPAANPLPQTDSINRYNYGKEDVAPRNTQPTNGNGLFALLSSFLPMNYDGDSTEDVIFEGYDVAMPDVDPVEDIANDEEAGGRIIPSINRLTSALQRLMEMLPASDNNHDILYDTDDSSDIDNINTENSNTNQGDVENRNLENNNQDNQNEN